MAKGKTVGVVVAEPSALPDGKICDYIDGKIRSDTPEEYVRQNIERRLVLELEFAPEQIEVELPIKIGSRHARVDLVVFREGQPHTQENAWILIECKQEAVKAAGAKDGIEQLKSYMAACPRAEWGMWTNGKEKAVFRREISVPAAPWEEPNDIPSRSGTVTEIDRPQRKRLRLAADDNLLFSFKVCHNHIYVTDGLQKQPAFFELLKVIFCKIADERNFPHALEFYATTREKASSDGQLTVERRIGKIFDVVKTRYPSIFDPADRIRLQTRSLAHVVGELQRYSLLDTDIDVKGKAYEELVGANLRGDRGEFFTPRNVQAMAVRMLDIRDGERVLDPTCGTGGFLVVAMSMMIARIRAAASDSGLDPERIQRAVMERAQELAAQCFFGVDINPDLAKATKMNMVMNNDGSGNIFRADSLLHPHQWDDAFRKVFARTLDIDPRTLRGPTDLGHFDCIATNPPFGARLQIKGREILEQYDLARVWRETTAGGLEMTDELQSSVPPEILFIERCWQFLRPGGRMAIVVPDAILGAPTLRYVRAWMLQRCRIIASVDLHPDTFQPRNGTQTSVLVLQRKTEKEVAQEAARRHLRDYEIFMAQVHSIGHDKRGKAVYQRSQDGAELWFPVAADASAPGQPLPRRRLRDDDTGRVAAEFLAWKQKAVLGW